MKRRITAKDQYTTYAMYPLVSGDVRAYEICLDLGADVTGAEFKVTAIRADGKIIEDIGQVKDGIAAYTMASNMYSVPGELTVRLAVLHDMSVLTDREIIFEVLDGPSATDNAETVVPLNDSVILRMATLETKLSEKVDKVSGKMLSSNDFTNEYKQKLDNLADTVGDQVERVSEEVDNLSDEFDEHKAEKSNPHSVTASQVGAYTKEEVNTKLNEKASKSDISNVYKFKGSVKTEADLPFKYTFEVSGDPYIIVDGEKEYIGDYEEDTGKVFFNNYHITVPAGGQVTVIFPVKTVKIQKGWYDITANVDFGEALADESYVVACHEIAGVPNMHASLPIYCAETDVTEIKVIYESDSYEYDGEVYFNLGRGKITGTLEKTVYEDTEEYMSNWGTICMMYRLSQGDVYNALDTDINYAWTGTEWDALGGLGKDDEAREMIGDIETALDSIIEIQNSLTGGEDV